MKFKNLLISGVLLFVVISPKLSAQSITQNTQIKFNTFNGVYYLSRNDKGLSLLTTEETIVAEFPSGGQFSGITREIPKTYNGHNVEVKIISVTDAAGNNISYKTSGDSDNVVIRTGDPDINIYGSQTFKFKYQTNGVINLSNSGDRLLLNVNGRGWNQSFDRVDAILHIASSFQSSIRGTPSCYTVLGNSNGNNCTIKIEKPDETLITSRMQPALSNQALVIKVDFAGSTFTNKPKNNKTMYLIAAVTVFFVGFSAYKRARRIKD